MISFALRNILTPDSLIDNNIRVDGRAEAIQIAQIVDQDRNNYVYYVDGYSPLQKCKIGEGVSI